MAGFNAARHNYFCDPWNWIDLSIVSLSVLDSWVWTFVQSGGGFEARAFFGIKIIRMLRLLRFVRLLRMFESLWLVVQGLLASIRTIVWVMALLFVIVYIFAVFTTIQIGQSDKQLTIGYDDENSYDEAKWPHKIYFGS